MRPDLCEWENRLHRPCPGDARVSTALRKSALGLLLGLLAASAALRAPAAPASSQPADLTPAETSAPRYFGVSPSVLPKVRARLAAGDTALQPAIKALTEEADEALQLTPPSVMQKTETPPSGDKHDYLSIAPYFWPDPARSNGLPYIRHDGKVNPESRGPASDRGRIGRMASTVDTLALAYYLTGTKAYAQQAAKFLRVWFLDPAARMNPNLTYAQGVLGVNEGRGTGIIEGRTIAEAADAAQLLKASAAWPQADDEALKVWLTTYLDWLLTSKNGKQEAAARNNHGTLYDMQAMRLALVLGKTGLAKQIAQTAKQKRIAVQIKPDGQQPLELARTASLSYSRLNLEALFLLATLAEHVGVDLWHYETPDGRSLRKALDFLLPYVDTPPRQWPHQQIKHYDRTEFGPILRQAGLTYHDPRYEAILAKQLGVSHNRLQLLFPQPPGLDVAGIDRDRILMAANAALTLEPPTITRFHAKLSEGGPNDFYSNGDYWWPDPSKPNGLPYIQRDGQSNTDNFSQHRLAIRQLRDAVAALGAAYKLTGDERFAAKGAELLRVFFLDPKTRMNAHLQYAQAIPGVSPGRGVGIIDALHLIEIPPAISAMQKSPAFPAETSAGLRQWFKDLAQWMATSKNGHDEANAKNNHAVAFWLQMAVYARFIGDEARLAECRRQFKEVFVPNQMALDGSFPAELKRTKPYGYSIFQLDNMCTLCQVLSTEQDDLWAFSLPDGRGIARAMEFLYPYLADKSKWPRKPDIQAWEHWPARQPCLLFAGTALREPRYLDLWKKLPPDPTDAEVRRNIAITQPLLWLQDQKPVNNTITR